MKTQSLALLLLALPLSGSAAPPVTTSGQARASDAVTASSLVGAERFWPYRVTLLEAWQPEGRNEALRPGTSGILIRVETPKRARIDFARAGKYEVPVEKTDLLARANRIRLGELQKSAPNFTQAIGAHLLDSTGEVLAGLVPDALADRPGFLCVFVDPSGEEFPALAASLRTLRDRADVMTILFPQGDHPDAAMRRRLRELEWPVPFVFDFLSEPYTRTLLADGTPVPVLLLQTNEGRVVFQDTWSPGVETELAAEIDLTFGGSSPALASTETGR